MKDYARSLNMAVTAVMMDRYLDAIAKQEIIQDLREVEEKLCECEDCELVYPPGTGE